MKECKYCKAEFGDDEYRKLGGHQTSCISNPSRRITLEKIKQKKILASPRSEYTIICNKCGSNFNVVITETEYSKGRYKKNCSLKCSNSRNLSNQTREKIKNTIINNFLYTEKLCKNCGSKISKTNKTGYCSRNKECRKLISSITSEKISKSTKGKTGGYRDKGGRGKQGWFNGIYCNSSWELAFLIWCRDEKIQVKRNKIGFSYFYKGKIKKFYPDFIIDGNYIEIKGYMGDQNTEKLSQFKGKLEVIGREEIGKYLKYTIEKYGKNFTNMYENTNDAKGCQHKG